jgi:hypothetical protein
MGSAHSSVPRWPTGDRGIDPAGRSFAVLAFDEAAATVAAIWCEEIQALDAPLWYAEDASALEEQLAGATVGWRLMLAGPQADVLAARSLAVEHGAIDAEITIVVTDDRERRVRCAHCTTSTRTAAARVHCAGCGRALDVHEHVSRRHAAYLGVASA